MIENLLEDIQPDPLCQSNPFYQENMLIINKLKLITEELFSEQDLIILSYKENHSHSFKNQKVTLKFDLSSCINFQDDDSHDCFELFLHEIAHLFYGSKKQIFSEKNWGFDDRGLVNYQSVFKTEVPVFILSFHLLRHFNIPHWSSISLQEYIEAEFRTLEMSTAFPFKNRNEIFMTFVKMMYEEFNNNKFNYEKFKKKLKEKIEKLSNFHNI